MAEIRRIPAKRVSGGFTLVEVMVAYLLLVIGLLGTAYLQTLSVQYGQQEDARTYINLAVANMIEQMRSQGIAANPPDGDTDPVKAYTDPLVSTELDQLNEKDKTALQNTCTLGPATRREQTVCFMYFLQQSVPLINMSIDTVDTTQPPDGTVDNYRITVFWSDRQMATGGDGGEQISQADCTGQNRIWSGSNTSLWDPVHYPDPGLCLTFQTWIFEIQPG